MLQNILSHRELQKAFASEISSQSMSQSLLLRGGSPQEVVVAPDHSVGISPLSMLAGANVVMRYVL